MATAKTNKKAEASPSTPQDTEPTSYGSGKPDKAIYDAEQTKLKADIDALQVKVVSYSR